MGPFFYDIIVTRAVLMGEKNGHFSSHYFQRVYILETHQRGLKDNTVISEVCSEFYVPGF